MVSARDLIDEIKYQLSQAKRCKKEGERIVIQVAKATHELLWEYARSRQTLCGSSSLVDDPKHYKALFGYEFVFKPSWSWGVAVVIEGEDSGEKTGEER